ncbi:MAG: glycerophosphodiester phosphodiesterase family protein [Gammaproteobacteria bacterium]|nr:glycerophosphodiester phosphodiesterase family protein [Gammaproteobacteria bacterium]
MTDAVTLPPERLVAHRGYPGRYPENSLPGMQAAIAAGALQVEFDVQFSRDGIPIVLHDESTARTTGRSGLVHEMPAEELRRLHVGEPARFGTSFPESPLPTLHCMLQLLAEFPQVTAFMDIKREGLSRLRCRHALAAMLNAMPDTLQRRQLVFLSEEIRIVRLAREAGLRTGWLFEPWHEKHYSTARQLGAEFLFTSARHLPETGEAFWRGPWTWVLYEVDEPAQAAALLERGAGLIETDWIAEWLGASPPVTATGTAS